MEHLEQLSKVLRYAGLNLNPQIISVILDKNVRELVETLDSRLKESDGDLSTKEIDDIVNAIDKAAKAQAEAAEKKKSNKPKLEKA